MFGKAQMHGQETTYSWFLTAPSVAKPCPKIQSIALTVGTAFKRRLEQFKRRQAALYSWFLQLHR